LQKKGTQALFATLNTASSSIHAASGKAGSGPIPLSDAAVKESGAATRQHSKLTQNTEEGGELTYDGSANAYSDDDSKKKRAKPQKHKRIGNMIKA
jgi:hypothetical protein